MATGHCDPKSDKNKPPKPIYNHNDFLLHMVTDKRTEMYVKFAKVMVMCQGPHSKRRIETVSKIVPKVFKTCSCVISDETYCVSTGKPCRYETTQEYYAYFKSTCQEALEMANNLIVLDPTMSNVLQNRIYMAMAYKMQYVFFVTPPFITKSNKPEWKKGSQAYSFRKADTYIPCANMFQHQFCAFYLHDSDSHVLRREGSLYVQDCLENIEDFQKLFTHVCPDDSEGNSKKSENASGCASAKCTLASFNKHFNLIDERQDLAFAVVKIFHNTNEVRDYFKQQDVLEHYGKMSKLLIAGFIVSPHMIAARVKLTHYQRPLWDIHDDLYESDENEVNDLLCPYELVQQIKAQLPEVDVQLVGSRTNPTLVNTRNKIFEPLDVIHEHARGRSCHIVLGKAPGAPKHNIDYDVAFALARERNAKKKKVELEVIDLERCVAKRIGKYWFIYLKEMLSIDSFFATCCKPFPYDQALK